MGGPDGRRTITATVADLDRELNPLLQHGRVFEALERLYSSDSTTRVEEDTMWRKLLATPDDRVQTLLRVMLGIVMFPHGAQKVLGWFGGFGFSGTMGAFTQQMHIPAGFAFLAIAAEFAGSLGLLVGLLARVAAFGIACNMLVAIALVHAKVGFMMNWFGQLQAGQEGYEYHLLVLALAAAVMIRGAGAWSVDRALTSRQG